MIIVAGGDSFVFGSELKDCPDGRQESYSRNTFTALLAQDNEYVCVAYPGMSNKEIVDAVTVYVDTVRTNYPLLLSEVAVIVCWTWPSRDNKVDAIDEIFRLQFYLQKINIPFMFTCADNVAFPKLLAKVTTLDLTNWFMFPAGTYPHETLEPRGFYQWAVENKYDVGPDNHPLEQAHLDASKVMQEKFNELVKKHIQ
jgi:hypothetical protein